MCLKDTCRNQLPINGTKDNFMFREKGLRAIGRREIVARKNRDKEKDLGENLPYQVHTR